MFRKILSFSVLAALVAMAALPEQADARSLTEIARQGAQRAHVQAAQATQRAQNEWMRYAPMTAAFNARMQSPNASVRTAAKNAYRSYLQGCQRLLRQADQAHYRAIRAFQHYQRVSRNPAVTGTINALNATRNGFSAHINEIQAIIIRVNAMR